MRLNGQISVKRRPSTVIDSEQKSIEQSELSASSSEEFEVGYFEILSRNLHYEGFLGERCPN